MEKEGQSSQEKILGLQSEFLQKRGTKQDKANKAQYTCFGEVVQEHIMREFYLSHGGMCFVMEGYLLKVP